MKGFKRLAALVFSFVFCLPALASAGVDFDYLTQLNTDFVGWLYQQESGLSQPVLQHETNDWYYERAFDGVKIYKTGSVYLSSDASIFDDVLVIRGQAREEGCLNLLPNWREQEYFDQHASFLLMTADGNWQADAFACLKVEKRDLKSWVTPEEDHAQWLERVQENSLVKADPASLPAEGDALLMIAGYHLNGSVTLVMARRAPTDYEPVQDQTKKQLDETPSLNGMVDAGPAGMLMYYAQNDPLYGDMRYESGRRNDVHRDFGGGGCGPTAMAIIAANLVEKENLPLLGDFARDPLGNLFCPCSVNRVYCNHTHIPYRMQTPDEYLRYLPVAIGDFAAGNNQWEMVARRVNAQGTNVRFVDYVCEVYGLSMTPVNGLEAALEMMKEKTGEGLILLSALRGSPYTNSSHFVVLAGVDDEYMYVLDPLRRTAEEYQKTDTRNIMEMLSPGVTRIRIEHYGRSDLSPVCYITRGE